MHFLRKSEESWQNSVGYLGNNLGAVTMRVEEELGHFERQSLESVWRARWSWRAYLEATILGHDRGKHRHALGQQLG